jgi:hypothetical protein
MQRSERPPPKRRIAAGVVVLLLSALAIGLTLAGHASAIDLPEQLRKAAKGAAAKKAPAANGVDAKRTGLIKGTALPKGVVPNISTALPSGPAPNVGAVLPKRKLPAIFCVSH